MSQLKRRLIFLGLCRDCRDNLAGQLRMLQNLRDEGSFEVLAIFGENGSNDGTRLLLDTIAKTEPWVEIVDTAFMAGIPERLARMAAGREALKLRLPPEKPRDVIIVLDTDLEIFGTLNEQIVRSVLLELETSEVFAVCSFSTPIFYDILSVLDMNHGPNPADVLYLNSLRPKSILRTIVSISEGLKVTSYQKQLGRRKGLKFVSAFNGICFYSRVDYIRGCYISECIRCEHITMNLTLNTLTGRHVVVSEHLGVVAPREHIASIWEGIIDRTSVMLKLNRATTSGLI